MSSNIPHLFIEQKPLPFVPCNNSESNVKCHPKVSYSLLILIKDDSQHHPWSPVPSPWNACSSSSEQGCSSMCYFPNNNVIYWHCLGWVERSQRRASQLDCSEQYKPPRERAIWRIHYPELTGDIHVICNLYFEGLC